MIAGEMAKVEEKLGEVMPIVMMATIQPIIAKLIVREHVCAFLTCANTLLFVVLLYCLITSLEQA